MQDKPQHHFPQAEHIGTPGLGFHLVAGIFVIGGVLGMFVNVIAGTVALVGGFVLAALGSIMNLLERIAHHTERMRSEQKDLKS